MDSSASQTPPADGRPKDARPTGTGGRTYTRLVVGLMVLAAVTVGLQLSWGGADSLSLRFLGGGIALGIAAILGWRILGSVRPDDPRPSPLAWVAFPMMLFGSLGMVPLLLLAIYPPARAWMDPQTLIRVRTVGENVEIVFPRPTRGNSFNVTFDGTHIPPDHFDRFPEHAVWRSHRRPDDNRVLRLDLPSLSAAFDLGRPTAVRINANPEAAPIAYVTGERVSQQRVVLPPPEGG